MDDADKRAEAALTAVCFWLECRPNTGARQLITIAIREVVAAERERCAAIADAFDVAPAHASSDYLHEQGRASAAADIALAIREGTPAKPVPAPARSKEPPKTPGYYAFRASPGEKPVMKLVGGTGTALFAATFLDAQLIPLGIHPEGEWWPIPIEVPPL
jgi:hypothetical protein